MLNNVVREIVLLFCASFSTLPCLLPSLCSHLPPLSLFTLLFLFCCFLKSLPCFLYLSPSYLLSPAPSPFSSIIPLLSVLLIRVLWSPFCASLSSLSAFSLCCSVFSLLSLCLLAFILFFFPPLSDCRKAGGRSCYQASSSTTRACKYIATCRQTFAGFRSLQCLGPSQSLGCHPHAIWISSSLVKK